MVTISIMCPDEWIVLLLLAVLLVDWKPFLGLASPSHETKRRKMAVYALGVESSLLWFAARACFAYVVFTHYYLDYTCSSTTDPLFSFAFTTSVWIVFIVFACLLQLRHLAYRYSGFVDLIGAYIIALVVFAIAVLTFVIIETAYTKEDSLEFWMFFIAACAAGLGTMGCSVAIAFRYFDKGVYDKWIRE